MLDPALITSSVSQFGLHWKRPAVTADGSNWLDPLSRLSAVHERKKARVSGRGLPLRSLRYFWSADLERPKCSFQEYDPLKRDPRQLDLFRSPTPSVGWTLAETRQLLHRCQIMILNTSRPANELAVLSKLEASLRKDIRVKQGRI
jgi:hypothetical protein